MMPQPLTSGDFISVRIVASSDDCNLYSFDRESRTLRLTGVHRVKAASPADLAVVTDSAAEGEDELPVVLLSHRAIPPGCLVSARPLGLLILRGESQTQELVVAVPGVDTTLAAWREFSDLPDGRCETIGDLARTLYPEFADSPLLWSDAAQAHALVHQRRQAARLAQARSPKANAATPAWKPLGYRALGARRASEIEPHSDAEYAFHQLPLRFQDYVNRYLTASERILFAVRRPAMRSAVQRSFLRRDLLQEGLMMITDQQVVLACEIMPPDLTGIRYGFAIQGGVPERIASAAARLESTRAFLDINWQTPMGHQAMSWEFPKAAHEELVEAATLLRAWQPRQNDTRLRRAFGAAQVEVRWLDPAAPDAASTAPLVERLTSKLTSELEPGELVLATALLPAWGARDKRARGLAVTDRRVLWLPDPAQNGRGQMASYPISQVASLEYQASIIESWLAFHVVNEAGSQRITVPFPYTAEDFRTCYQALRQQLVASRLGS